MQTDPRTIVALIGELIETHMAKCDEPVHEDDRIAHVISETFDTQANIETVANADTMLTLTLDDGSAFAVKVERISG